VPALAGVCISEYVLGAPLVSAGRFSWQKAHREGCLQDSEAFWMALRGFKGRTLSIRLIGGREWAALGGASFERWIFFWKRACVVGSRECGGRLSL
jgi:hypothetical protein